MGRSRFDTCTHGAAVQHLLGTSGRAQSPLVVRSRGPGSGVGQAYESYDAGAPCVSARWSLHAPGELRSPAVGEAHLFAGRGGVRGHRPRLGSDLRRRLSGSVCCATGRAKRMGEEERRRWEMTDWRWIDPADRFAFDKSFWQIVSTNWTPAEIARLMHRLEEPAGEAPGS